MKCFKLLIVIFCFYGCGVSENQYDDLKSENLILRKELIHFQKN
jgi:hypothetical protein